MAIIRVRQGSAMNIVFMTLCLNALFLGGCQHFSSQGTIRINSLGDNPVVLTAEFHTVGFDHQPDAETSFWLSDVSIDDLMSGTVINGQILHIELLWLPRPGSTPIDSSATNASIRYIVIANGEVGVYIGAGFVMPHNDLDSSRLTVTVRDASLKLGDSTDGLVDLLSPAHLSGQFTAHRDPDLTRQFRLAASQFVTDALGRTRFVQTSRTPTLFAKSN